MTLKLTLNFSRLLEMAEFDKACITCMLVLTVINLLTKFEVHTFICSKDKMGAPKVNKSSAVAEMGHHGHSRHGPKRREAAVPLSQGELGPRLTQCGQD